MKRFIACLLGAALVIAGPALAENDEPYDPSEANWEFKWLNDAGREVGKRRATEAFATVEGRRNLRLSIGCNLEEKRRVIRIERDVENEERAQFSERVLDFEVVVWYRGDIIFTTERGVLRWQEDEGYYEGRAGRVLQRHRTAALRLMGLGAEHPPPPLDGRHRMAFLLSGKVAALRPH